MPRDEAGREDERAGADERAEDEWTADERGMDERAGAEMRDEPVREVGRKAVREEAGRGWLEILGVDERVFWVRERIERELAVERIEGVAFWKSGFCLDWVNFPAILPLNFCWARETVLLLG